MSDLIEDSLFYPEMSNQKRSKSNGTILNDGKVLTQKRQYQSREIQDQSHNFQIQPYVFADKNCYVHKVQNFNLVLIRRKLQQRNYRFQGFVLSGNRKLCIQYKQKRILFGKQWMKNKHQWPVKVSINFSTGQICLLWPQVFNPYVDSVISSSKTIPNTSACVFKEFVKIFQRDLIPIFHKLQIFCNETLNQGLQKDKKFKPNTQEAEQSQKYTQKIHKYLNMSTIIDSFDRDKQTFRQVQDKAVKQKQNIIKIQNSIDKSFANILNQLKLFTNYTLKKALKKLINFGIIDPDEKMILEECLQNEQPKGSFANKHQFILNCIGILKMDSKKRFLGSGGISNVFLTKTKFQYVFSDDPQFWIEQNKSLTNNIIEKHFVIKQAKKGFEQKVKHQNQIIKQMKGGFSIFLPKYYRIQISTSEADMPRNDNFLIMDYLRGDNLDVYVDNSSEVLSFWSKVFLVRNIVNGLRFILGYKIVHLDLKPSNIIVISDLLTKIIDFSQAYHPKICKQNYKPGITYPYSCPQTFSKKPPNYDQKCDIFSLGVIMYQLFLRKPLFQLEKQKISSLYSNHQYLQRIFTAPQQFDDEQLGPIFQIMYQLTMRCLDPQPGRRPTLNWISIIITHVLMVFRGR